MIRDVRYLYDRRVKTPERGYYERKKKNKFVKEGIFVSGDFSGLCVKNVRKYFITACKKKKERNDENK